MDPPESIVAATWSHDDHSIILLNNGTRTLDVYSLDGRRQKRIASPGRGDLDFNVPAGIQRTADGFVLNDDGQRLLWLDRKLRPFRAFDLQKAEAGTQLWLTPSDITGREAIGLVTRDRVGKAEDYGFFRLQLEPGAGAPELLDPIPMPQGRAPEAGPTWRFQALSVIHGSLVRLGDRVL